MELPPQQLSEIVEALRQQDRAGAGAEKRRSTRILVSAKVKVIDHATGREFVALTVDFSVGGLGLMQSFQASAGQRITVSLPRRRGGAFTIQCAVTHAREPAQGVWLVGAKFLSLVVVTQPSTQGPDAEALRIQSRMLP